MKLKKTARQLWLERELRLEKARNKKQKGDIDKQKKIERNNWFITQSIKFRDELITNATVPEKIVLNAIKKSIYKDDFEFQRPEYIKDKNGLVKKFYICDFVIFSKKVVIEIDGASHDTEDRRRKDEQKDKDLMKLGYKVLRISNKHVMEDKKCNDLFVTLDRI